ncbi:hypothetical protein An16g05530 [Aspergillus niger]|uniref:Uncharacterized protein n=2 Tax=Aspergillus niger TaxID=5061 RepID=A2R819_ASPNC|nr:hypothetical protein An16g05530 [Aspergillus niger]CAK46893.1 hypothetical protein An16g05530 [Aspergillus niger]
MVEKTGNVRLEWVKGPFRTHAEWGMWAISDGMINFWVSPPRRLQVEMAELTSVPISCLGSPSDPRRWSLALSCILVGHLSPGGLLLDPRPILIPHRHLPITNHHLIPTTGDATRFPGLVAISGNPSPTRFYLKVRQHARLSSLFMLARIPYLRADRSSITHPPV